MRGRAEIEFSYDAIAAKLQDSLAESNRIQSQQNQPINVVGLNKQAPMTYDKWLNSFNDCKESNDRILDQFEADCEIRKQNQMRVKYIQIVVMKDSQYGPGNTTSQCTELMLMSFGNKLSLTSSRCRKCND